MKELTKEQLQQLEEACEVLVKSWQQEVIDKGDEMGIIVTFKKKEVKDLFNQ